MTAQRNLTNDQLNQLARRLAGTTDRVCDAKADMPAPAPVMHDIRRYPSNVRYAAEVLQHEQQRLNRQMQLSEPLIAANPQVRSYQDAWRYGVERLAAISDALELLQMPMTRLAAGEQLKRREREDA